MSGQGQGWPQKSLHVIWEVEGRSLCSSGWSEALAAVAASARGGLFATAFPCWLWDAAHPGLLQLLPESLLGFSKSWTDCMCNSVVKERHRLLPQVTSLIKSGGHKRQMQVPRCPSGSRLPLWGPVCSCPSPPHIQGFFSIPVLLIYSNFRPPT